MIGVRRDLALTWREGFAFEDSPVLRCTSMRSARAKVVKGKIVTRAKFPEGTKLLLVVDDPVPPIVLTEEDGLAVRRARASVRAGRTIKFEDLMSLLESL
jgi:hypothetical protein